LALRMIAERRLDAGSRVVEIASNDGYLLQYYRDAGIPVLGVEPARAIARMARERGIATEAEFFTLDLARRLLASGVAADIVHANNVLAHVPDLNGFVAGIAAILKPGGVAVIEFPYLLDLIDGLEFDTVYHEHLAYFSLTALIPVFARQGLQIVEIERLTVHGGSLRLFARPTGVSETAPSVERMLAAERAWGVGDPATYRRFAAAVESLGPQIREFLVGLHVQGRSIAAYGAAAKGATLLNYCGIGRDLIDFVVDRSPLKQGLVMPGVGLPILAPEELLQRWPDFVLLLAWNFADEIVAQQAEYRQSGRRFIVPVPRPAIL
jgi:SAM-dependent methyltransferase